MALLDPWQNAETWDILRDKINLIKDAVNKIGGGTTGQIFRKASDDDFDLEAIDHIPIPAVTAATKRILIEKSDGSGVEWYSPFKEYKSIPMQATGIMNSTGTYATLRNTGSTVFLNVSVPNDGRTRKLLFISSCYLSNTADDGDADFSFRNVTSDVTLQTNTIETGFRKYPTIIYSADIVCNGQEYAVQFKTHDGSASAFLGGYLSVIELL